MALETQLATTGDSGAVSFALEMLAADPTDLATTGDSGAVSFSLDLLAVVPQQLETTGDSGAVSFALEMLAGDPRDMATSGDSGTVTFTIEVLEGGYYVFEAYAQPARGEVEFFLWMSGGAMPEAITRKVEGYGINRLYERSLMGFYPLYFYDLTTLAHKGWYPEWAVLWVERTNASAAWRERENAPSTWTERTNASAAWTERT